MGQNIKAKTKKNKNTSESHKKCLYSKRTLLHMVFHQATQIIHAVNTIKNWLKYNSVWLVIHLNIEHKINKNTGAE